MTAHNERRTQVAIVGAGPVGLSLALGLARHGVRSVLVERKAATNEQSRAPALHLRTLEALGQWGIADRLRQAGALKRTLPIYQGPDATGPLLAFDFTQLDDEAADAGVLFLEQGRTERLLLEALAATGRCDIRFATEAVALDPQPDHVRCSVGDGEAEQSLRADYVVGCDGTASFVRRALGVGFDGFTYPLRATLADVRIHDQRDALPWPRLHNGAGGFTGAQRLNAQHWRIVRVEPGEPTPDEPVPDDELARRVGEVLGDGPFEVLWASRFAFQRRNAPRYRHGRVLLAGDAAHAFPPANGQGMNAGIQDAHNLAWKLAHAVRGGDTERLLDSYDTERRSVVGTVARNVSGLTRVGIQAPRSVRAAVLQLMRVALAVGPAHRRRVRNLAMIDLDLPASPLLNRSDRAAGRRLPNVRLARPDGSTVRLYDLLPAGAALLAVGDGADALPDLPVDATIPLRAESHGAERLRSLLGGPQGWILVRPDLHVAWATRDQATLHAATRRALGWGPS